MRNKAQPFKWGVKIAYFTIARKALGQAPKVAPFFYQTLYYVRLGGCTFEGFVRYVQVVTNFCQICLMGIEEC